MSPLSRSLALAALLTAPSAAHAGDYYVDAVNGSDANAGTSPGAAWRTLTHAMTTVGGTNHTFHVATGLYDAAHGEQYPLTAPEFSRVVADPGADVILEGPSIFRVVRVGITEVPSNEFVGLTLRGLGGVGGWGIEAISLGPSDEEAFLRLEDCVLQDLGTGIDIAGGGVTSFSISRVRLYDCRVERCSVGVYADPGGDSSQSVSIHDSVFVDNLTGVRCKDCGVAAQNSEFRGDGGVALSVTNGGCYISGSSFFGKEAAVDNSPGSGIVGSALRILDSRFSGNGTAIRATNQVVELDEVLLWRNGVACDFGSLDSADIQRTTVASNGTGLLAINSDCDLNSTIVKGNDQNLSLTSSMLQATYSDLGGGYGGLPTNINLDPKFWDPEAGDHHLAPGSPCIDVGDPSLPPDADGSRADMGALPYEPSYAPEPSTYCTAGVNSLGQQAAIGAFGFPSQLFNAFTLEAQGCPPGVLALFFYGSTPANTPLGNGTLCVGGAGSPVVRLGPPQTTDAQGRVARLLDFSSAPAGSGAQAIPPGELRYFQLWYRDPASSGPTFNLSNGLKAGFLP